VSAAARSAVIVSSDTSPPEVGEDALDELRPVMRLCALLGVSAALVCCPVTSLVSSSSSSVCAGRVCRVSDHINLSGHNPLFGHNDDRYGARFPDCSHLYDSDDDGNDTCSDSSSSIVSSAPRSPRLVVACIDSPLHLSLPAGRRWLLSVGANAVCPPGLLSLALIARHMAVRTSVIAWIAFAMDEEGEEAKWLSSGHEDNRGKLAASQLSSAVLRWIERAPRMASVPAETAKKVRVAAIAP
jgi:hypothetical protein